MKQKTKNKKPKRIICSYCLKYSKNFIFGLGCENCNKTIKSKR